MLLSLNVRTSLNLRYSSSCGTVATTVDTDCKQYLERLVLLLVNLFIYSYSLIYLTRKTTQQSTADF